VNQKDILDTLSKKEQEILQNVLQLEQAKLNVINMQDNSSEEKDLVNNIYLLIKGKIKDET